MPVDNNLSNWNKENETTSKTKNNSLLFRSHSSFNLSILKNHTNSNNFLTPKVREEKTYSEDSLANSSTDELRYAEIQNALVDEHDDLSMSEDEILKLCSWYSDDESKDDGIDTMEIDSDDEDLFHEVILRLNQTWEERPKQIETSNYYTEVTKCPKVSHMSMFIDSEFALDASF